MTTAIIPFRKGSKGVPGKNTRVVAGAPLWEWSLKAAVDSIRVDRLAVSTDIYGLRDEGPGFPPVVPRPPELATDTASLDAALVHAVNYLELPTEEIVVVLQPTVPVRRPGLIDDCVAMFERFPAARSLLTANRLHFVWHGASGAMINGPRVNRQEMAQDQCHFEEDGSVYVVRAGDLRIHGNRCAQPGILFETERTVDIDTEADMALAEFLLSRD